MQPCEAYPTENSYYTWLATAVETFLTDYAYLRQQCLQIIKVVTRKCKL